MAAQARVFINSKTLESTQTTQYTAVSLRARIDKFTLTNQDAVPRAVSVNIVPSGGSAGASNLVLKSKNLLPGQTYECPEIVGQLLEPGDFISTLAPAASSVTCRANGFEIS